MTDPLSQISDPFDLPEWLGTKPLTWVSESSLDSDTAEGALTTVDGDRLRLDIVAADRAYPGPVVAEDVRTSVHQAWFHGQVLIMCDAGTQTLAVPAVRLDADLVCEALRRFAKAVGVAANRLSVTIRL